MVFDTHFTSVRQTDEFVDSTMEDILEGMIHDVGTKSFIEVVYENMSTDAETPLYPGPTNITRLSTMLS